MPRRRVALVLALLVGAALLLFLRCRPAPASPLATLVCLNEAGSGWRISFVNTSGGTARTLRLPPHGEARLELDPGDYVVSQVLVDIQGRALDRREARVSLERGRTYRWRLLTLHSRPPEGAVR